jgi:hypothetical protein
VAGVSYESLYFIEDFTVPKDTGLIVLAIRRGPRLLDLRVEDTLDMECSHVLHPRHADCCRALCYMDWRRCDILSRRRMVGENCTSVLLIGIASIQKYAPPELIRQMKFLTRFFPGFASPSLCTLMRHVAIVKERAHVKRRLSFLYTGLTRRRISVTLRNSLFLQLLSKGSRSCGRELVASKPC